LLHGRFFELVSDEDAPKLGQELKPKGRREDVNDDGGSDDPSDKGDDVSQDQKDGNHDDTQESDVVNLLKDQKRSLSIISLHLPVSWFWIFKGERERVQERERTRERLQTEIAMSLPSLNSEGTFLIANVNMIPTIITRA